MIEIYIVEDQNLFRRGLTSVINSMAQMKVIGESESTDDLTNILIDSSPPDIIILDDTIPDNSLKENIALFKDINFSRRILVLSSNDDATSIETALSSGCGGYLSKDAEPLQVEEAIRTIYKGDYYYPMESINRMLKQKKIVSIKQGEHSDDILTNREKDILKLILNEYSSSDIAVQLKLSRRTVETHRNNIMRKVGTKNTVGLVLAGLRLNLLDVDELNKTYGN